MSKSRSFLRRSRSSPEGGTARVDRRTKTLLRRIQPGEIAVIDHEDIDRVAADGLVSAGVAGVVNAARSSSGRYPNLGPLTLTRADIPVVDEVGPLLLQKVREGDPIRLDGDRVYVGNRVVAVGIRQTEVSVTDALETAHRSLAEQFESFARNTLDYMQKERDLLFGGSGLPDLDHDLTHRQVLVVVRGTGYRRDLATLQPYISEVHPVLIGVDGGADALVEAGYRPDVIVGDMDSVSERALMLAGRPRGLFRRRPPTEVILHAYPGGVAPGKSRLEALGIPFKVVEAGGTSEDVAYLMAHEKRADLIVSVGSHANLREFLDKGRMGMASTFLVRLRVGEILMDAKGVSRLYPGRVRGKETAALIGSALFAIAVVVLVSEPLRLYFGQLVNDFVFWIKGLI
ncbi:MAG: putative cytokinetic ring protein SteA [Actinomycetota bacterium]